MALTCNIDAKGKALRLICGITLGAAGIVLAIFWARASGSVFRWTLAIAMIAIGAFAVFEARAGWCAVRAMGFKTRI